MNYHEIVTQGEERQRRYLAAAEQERLLASVATAQPHPLFVWLGLRWVGKWALGKKHRPTSPMTPAASRR